MKKIFFFIIALTLCTTITHTAFPPMPPMGGGGMPGMPFNPADLEAMSQELEKIIDSMPPEERKAFDAEVARLTEDMSKMSPDELDNFLNQVFSEEPMPTPPPAPVVPVSAPAPTPIIEPVKAPEKRVETQVSAQNKQELFVMLDKMIKQLEHFIVATHSWIQFTGKIEKWGRRGEIEGWSESTTWSGLSKKIDALIAQLHKVIMREPKHQEYKYLDDVLDNKELYKKLQSLAQILNKHEPKIVIPAIDAPVSEETRKTFLIITGALATALEVNNLSTDLDEILTKYEPRAIKLKEEEEKSAKRAFDEAKRGTRGSATLTSKVSSADFPNYPPAAPPSIPGDFGQAYYPTTGFAGYPQDYGSHGVPYQPGYAPAGASAAQPSASAGSTKKPESKEEEEKEKEKNKSESDKKFESAVDKIFNDIDEALDEAADVLNFDLFKVLQSHLLDASAVNDSLITRAQTAKNRIKKAVDKNLDALNRKVKKYSAAQKAEVKKGLLEIYDKYKDPFNKIAYQIRAIANNLTALEAKVINKDKLFAYIDNTYKASKKLLGQSPSTTTWLELLEAFDNLTNKIQKLDYKPSWQSTAPAQEATEEIVPKLPAAPAVDRSAMPVSDRPAAVDDDID